MFSFLTVFFKNLFVFSFFQIVEKDQVLVWGLNEEGKLGIENEENQNTPQIFPFKASDIILFHQGNRFCVCVTKNGVFSWGNNSSGQLGNGKNENENKPQKIEFFSNPEEIISICCGFNFCIAITKNGVFSWGDNEFGQLGNGKNENENKPQKIEFFSKSFSKLKFPINSNFDFYKKERILFLILCREYCFESVFDQDYLPLDLLKIFLNF